MPRERRPLLLVIEDGHEYTSRFQRLLGDDLRFERASDLAAARDLLSRVAVAGLVLDLDFRRTAAAALVDDAGTVGAAAAGTEAASRLAAAQGIHVLRALRAGGHTMPAWLFADLDDAAQRAFLEATMAPLAIVASTASLADVAVVWRGLSASPVEP